MDWSLVLLSQGIEATITPPDETTGWSLLVSEPELERADAILRQYQLENRRWKWRREVLRPGILFDWGCVAWVFLILIFYALSGMIDLRSAGRVDSSALAHGQWWRVFTAEWLHGDVGHLASNATIGVVLLGFVMGRYGTCIGLLAAYLAGAAGNVFASVFSGGHHLSLGASGLVMSCLGLLGAQTASWYWHSPHSWKILVSSAGAGVLLFALFGLSPETDVLAHLGGFLGGAAIGFPLARRPSLAQNPGANVLCGILFTLLVIIPWWLALTHAAAAVSR